MVHNPNTMDVDATAREIKEQSSKKVTKGCMGAKSVNCFACGKFGHYTSYCPTKKPETKHPAGHVAVKTTQRGPLTKTKGKQKEEPSESRIEEVDKDFQED